MSSTTARRPRRSRAAADGTTEQRAAADRPPAGRGQDRAAPGGPAAGRGAVRAPAGRTTAGRVAASRIAALLRRARERIRHASAPVTDVVGPLGWLLLGLVMLLATLGTALGWDEAVIAAVLGAVLLLLNGTIFVVVANSLLPQHCRGTGVGLGYGIGVALFGGTASYILIWLQGQGQLWVFPVYVAILCALSVIFYVLAKRKHGIYVGS